MVAIFRAIYVPSTNLYTVESEFDENTRITAKIFGNGSTSGLDFSAPGGYYSNSIDTALATWAGTVGLL
jgi:hypothetical protein